MLLPDAYGGSAAVILPVCHLWRRAHPFELKRVRHPEKQRRGLAV
jgi:hypothetical protein